MLSRNAASGTDSKSLDWSFIWPSLNVHESRLDYLAQYCYGYSVTSKHLSKEDRARLEVAGISDEGGLGRPLALPGGPLVPEKLEIEDGFLWWPQVGATKPVENTSGMLDTFLRIKNDGGVLRFAQRYGVLEICEHGMLPPHRREREDPLTGDLRLSYTECQPRRHKAWYLEPIAFWHSYVEQFVAMLRVAEALDSGRFPTESDWNVIRWERELPTTVENYWREFNSLLFGYVYQASVKVSIEYSGRPPEIRFDAGTYGLLAVQLAIAIGRVGDVAVCSGCRKPYIREGRRPQRNRRNWCVDCQTTVAARRRKRDQRTRKAGQS